MSMEIKQGDKVRVYLRGFAHIFTSLEGVVMEVEDNNAVVVLDNEYIYRRTVIPTKYLVKVDAEAKEPTAPKIKVGDRVEELVSRKSGKVLGIDGDFLVVGIPYDLEKQYWHIDSVELCLPSEQTEAEETDADKKIKGGLTDDFKEKIKYQIEMFADGAYWSAYTAILAKEVALKVTNKHMDGKPEDIGAYAVQVAKAVVEGLKRKWV